MKTFTPIAMKCTQEQWDSIKGRIPEEIEIFMIGEFKKDYYIVIFPDKSITNGTISDRSDKIIHETFNAKTFLEASGIETDVYGITKGQLKNLIEATFCNMKDYVMNNDGFIDDWIKTIIPDAFKKELEVGKWYTPCNENEGVALLYCENPENKHSCGYGFDFKGNWTRTYSIIASDHVTYRKATPQEVKDALICEAKKRGYKDGVSFKSAVSNFVDICNGNFIYNAELNKLYSNGTCVFSNGIWATIIQPEKMTHEQIEKELGRKIEIV
jgi:hypothetical protein